MNQHYCKTLFLVVALFSYTNGFGQEEGSYQGMHWQITGEGYKSEQRLIVDGDTKLNYKHAIRPKEIGGKLYFEAMVELSGNYLNQLYSIKGDRVIPYNYSWLEFSKNEEEWYWVKATRVDNPDLLYTSDLKLLHSNAASLNPEIVTFEGVNGKFLKVYLEHEDKLVYALYSKDWKLVVPIYRSLYLSGEHFKYVSLNGFEGKLDKTFHWIGPSPNQAQQFEKVEKLANGLYYKCKRNGYWGLYDSNLKEIVAPDYEDFGYFEDTNFIKFKLNGFWGVMAIQGKLSKIIIPTTRGYTNISRYVKSQRRFMYEMAGYKGECDATGRQISKIKVDTPRPNTSVASSSSSSSSSASNSSNNSNSGNNTTTIHVEHHHDPVPVQQWQACFGCGGMGTMGCDFCGGSGTKYIGDRLHICSRCNGKGIIPCNVCYGNKGQYVTVYK